LSLQEDIHLDLAILVTSFGVVDVALAVEIGNDDNALFVMVVVEEPSWGRSEILCADMEKG